MSQPLARDPETGKLPAYAWPGGYPLYYLTPEDSALCPHCANNEIVTSSEVNWSDPELPCECCGDFIEAAYVEDVQ